MSNLIVSEVKLPVSQQEFVSLRIGNKPVKQMSPNALKRSCTDILTKASFDMGSPMADDPKILQFQTEALFKELAGKFGALTLPEVTEAFNRGIRGESGPYFGICPKTYHQFLKWFFELPARGKAWLAFLETSEQKQLPDKPVELTRDQLINSCKEAFETYKTDGTLPFFPHATYDILKSLLEVKTLIPTQIWKQVKAEAKKNLVEITKRKAVRKTDIPGMLKKLVFTEGSQYEFECKKVGLKCYFDNLIKSGSNLPI